MKLLLVEDNSDVLFLLQRALAISHHVITAKSGIEAIDLLSSNHVDVVISDIMMPNGDGLWLLKQITQCNIQIPVLLMTAGSLPTKQEVLALGAKDLFRKPLDLNALEKVLENIRSLK